MTTNTAAAITATIQEHHGEEAAVQYVEALVAQRQLSEYEMAFARHIRARGRELQRNLDYQPRIQQRAARQQEPTKQQEPQR